MKDEFYRIKRLPPYVFAEVNAVKAAHRGQGRDIIDLGMGNPDKPPAPHIIEKLKETAMDPKAHRYSISRGIPGLRKAHAAYYQRRFGVELSPETEIITTIGSKEGLANLAQAITSPGDVVMVPNPSYPIHPYGSIIAGASVWALPKTPETNLIDEIKTAIKHCNPKPIALILNYPCNPTAEVVGLDFYEEVVDICRYHEIFILSDLAYCEVYFNDVPPPSILQVKHAKEVAVEFTTMSKTYSMAGWRVGFAAGCPTLIKALTKIKSYLDYGAFTPIQVAATAALNGPQDILDEMRAMYKARRDVVMDGLSKAGWYAPTPDASMFVWAPLPEAYRSIGSLDFAKLLLNRAEVAVAPGIGFGQYGDGYVRIALVENRHRLRQAMRNIREFMQEDPQQHLAALRAA